MIKYIQYNFINEDRPNFVIRLSDGANIPCNIENRDYREFLETPTSEVETIQIGDD